MLGWPLVIWVQQLGSPSKEKIPQRQTFMEFKALKVFELGWMYVRRNWHFKKNHLWLYVKTFFIFILPWTIKLTVAKHRFQTGCKTNLLQRIFPHRVFSLFLYCVDHCSPCGPWLQNVPFLWPHSNCRHWWYWCNAQLYFMLMLSSGMDTLALGWPISLVTTSCWLRFEETLLTERNSHLESNTIHYYWS